MRKFHVGNLRLQYLGLCSHFCMVGQSLLEVGVYIRRLLQKELHDIP